MLNATFSVIFKLRATTRVDCITAMYCFLEIQGYIATLAKNTADTELSLKVPKVSLQQNYQIFF